MSNSKNVVFSTKADQPLEVQVFAISNWSGFDQLIEFIKKEYDAVIVENIEGPDARICTLSVNDERFELRYEHPYGNSLHSLTLDKNSIVKIIGLDLANRLKNL